MKGNTCMIQAIETLYAGCRFRSRLEARWAVFFDHLGIEWQYEPEGYELSCGRYLPDFLLPECSTWIEVKGSEAALDKPMLRTASKELPELPHSGEIGPRLLILGPIPDPLPDEAWGDYGWYSPADGHRYGFGIFHFKRKPVRLDYDEENPDDWTIPLLSHWGALPNSHRAYAAARSARFEHGETPIPPAKPPPPPRFVEPWVDALLAGEQGWRPAVLLDQDFIAGDEMHTDPEWEAQLWDEGRPYVLEGM